jgi:hypothetical protein
MIQVRFVHGRTGNPGCIQVNIDQRDSTSYPYVAHFRRMWTTVGCVAPCSLDDYVILTP